jgi:hypothetical protein
MGNDPILTLSQSVVLNLYTMVTIDFATYWWVLMVTLHELNFPSLRVTVLQTADGGNTLILYYHIIAHYSSVYITI